MSDAILIAIGVSGVSWFIGDLIKAYSFWTFGAAALWLMVYGAIHLRSAFRQNWLILDEMQAEKPLLSVLSTAALFTFGNPHVYLDTVILIGSLSIPFGPENLLPFAIGATLASFIFFSALGLGAVKLSPLFNSPRAWRFVEIFTATIMFIFCLSFLKLGGWF